MSNNIDVIARVQIGDADLSQSFTSLATASEFELPRDMRGKVVRFRVTADMYFSATSSGSTSAGDPATNSGVKIEADKSEDFFIPEGAGTYKFKSIGAGTIYCDVVSP